VERNKLNNFGVLFVCLGNICRSPLAEGIFRKLVRDANFAEQVRVESCGTGGWHSGEPAHHESVWVASQRGVDISSHRARKIRNQDFSEFQLIVVMDQSNYREVIQLAGRDDANVVKLRAFDDGPVGGDVPDPYYGKREDFVEVFAMIERCCLNLWNRILRDRFNSDR
jgi:protein-tyrosine phosphatase